MCAAVVAAVEALGPSAVSGEVLPWTLIVFAVLLIAANSLQSWLIVEKLTSRIGRFQKEVRPKWGRFRRRLMRVALVVVLAPVLVAIFQGFSVLIMWAVKGGK